MDIIPISIVASESSFSTGVRVFDQFRSSLTPKLVESFVCAHHWLRSPSSSIDDEENLEDMEEIKNQGYQMVWNWNRIILQIR